MFKLLRSISFTCTQSHCRFFVNSFSSSSSPKVASSSFLVDYLINSIGFHEHQAIAVSSKVPHLKSTTNSDLVVTAFKDYGLNNVQIRNIISVVPKILTMKADKTLEPKLRVFRELGLPGADLVALVRKNRVILRTGLHTQIIPTVDYLRKLLGSDEKVLKTINRSRWMLLPNNMIKHISANVSLLQSYGVPDDKILKFFMVDPQGMKKTPELFEGNMRYVELNLGISRCSSMFIHGLNAVMYWSELKIEKIREIFRSFGWLDCEISDLFRAQPYCLNKSEGYISDKLKFFMVELNYKPAYLIGCTSLWTLSLEKRLKPRYEVFKILKKRGLVKDGRSLITVVKYSDSKFLCFLKRFESQIPGLCETYTDSICH